MTRRNKRIRISLLHVASAFFLLIILAGLIFFFVFINSQGIWQATGRTNIVLNTKPVLVVSLDHDRNGLNVISIPSDTYVEVPKGYGRYRLSKVYFLDKLEKKHGKLFLGTVSDMLGVSVLGFVDYENGLTLEKEEKNFSRDQFMTVKNDLFNPRFLLPSFSPQTLVATNLSFFDRWKIFWFLSGAKGSKVAFINLTIDDSQTTPLVYEKIDYTTKSFLNESKISDEALKIEVLNTTSIVGLAEKAGRIIVNLGSQVINVANSHEKVDTCKIYSDQKLARSYTAKRLAKVFSCKLEDSKLPDSRADLSVLVGEKIFKDE